MLTVTATSCDKYIYFGGIMRSHDVSHQCELSQLLYSICSFSSTDYPDYGGIKLFLLRGTLHKLLMERK